MLGRQLVYRYDGDPQSEEAEVDLLEQVPIPKEDGVLKKKGHLWKVSVIQVTESVSDPPALPIYRMFLTKLD